MGGSRQASGCRRPFWLFLGVFALVDFGLTFVGRALTPRPSSFAAFWPAAGFVLGALLLSERRRWPFILAAASVPIAVFNLLGGLPLGLVLTFAAANVAESLCGAWLTLRLCHGRPRIARLEHLGAFVVAAPLLASGLATTLSAGGLRWAFGSSFLDPFPRLWLGSALGTLAVAPLLLAWTEASPLAAKLAGRRILEALGLAAVFALTAGLVFVAERRSFTFDAALFLPVLLWAALRFRPPGATVGGLLLTLVALSATVRGRGAFVAGLSADADVLSAQLFCAVTLFSVLAMTCVVESRRLGAEALARSELELRLVRFATDATTDLIACIDAKGTVVHANDALRALAGGAGATLVGKPIWSAGDTVTPHSWSVHWRDVRRHGAVTTELLAKVAGTASLPLEVRSSYLRFGGEEYCVSVGRGVRERRQAEAALRMASVGTMAAGMAHEINNPLAYVMGNLSWISEELELAAKALATPAQEAAALAGTLAAIREALGETTEGATRIRDIVRDLKLFARTAEREGPAVANVEHALRSAVTMARHEIRHRGRLVFQVEEVPLAAGDEHRLGQVFLNLIVNAAQAIPSGHVTRNFIRVGARPLGRSEVAVEVEDTGCGMTPEVVAHVFEPFFTTKPVGSGTGLGLSICHGIVEAVGGRIEVSSRPGAGSLFRVVLPVAVGAPRRGHAASGSPVAARQGRILVVDDDLLVSRSLERLLAEHEVVACAHAAAALERVAEDRFDVILCDLMMPEMTGMEFQEKLAFDHPELASGMIFLTGGAFTPEARAFLERTPNVHLQKPFDLEAFRTEVARALTRARQPVTGSGRRTLADADPA